LHKDTSGLGFVEHGWGSFVTGFATGTGTDITADNACSMDSRFFIDV